MTFFAVYLCRCLVVNFKSSIVAGSRSFLISYLSKTHQMLSCIFGISSVCSERDFRTKIRSLAILSICQISVCEQHRTACMNHCVPRYPISAASDFVFPMSGSFQTLVRSSAEDNSRLLLCVFTVPVFLQLLLTKIMNYH